MKKFWRDDFAYIRRTMSSDYVYHFSVKGESFNYLYNKYELGFPNMEIHIFNKQSATVITESNDKKEADVADIEEDDIEELIDILWDYIELDKLCWEEYCCDSEYYMWDDRWG